MGCVVKSTMTLHKLALVVLPEDGPLRAKTCWSDKSVKEVI
jgi:hypothetical protein